MLTLIGRLADRDGRLESPKTISKKNEKEFRVLLYTIGGGKRLSVVLTNGRTVLLLFQLLTWMGGCGCTAVPRATAAWDCCSWHVSMDRASLSQGEKGPLRL